MGETAVRTGPGGYRSAVVVGLAVCGALGLFLGFQWRASEGNDCGPIAGLDEVVIRFGIVAIAVVLFIVAALAALTRNRGAALGCLAAVAGFVIAVVVGYSVGEPVDRCGSPTDTSEPAMLTLHLGTPLNLEVTGPGDCTRDSDAGVSVGAVTESGSGTWTTEGYEVVDISLGNGPSLPGLQIGLVRDDRTNIVFRQTADAQVVERVAADGHSGTLGFDLLPLLADSDVTEPQQISGTIEWSC